MYFDRKAVERYLRRRHKLYKAVNKELYDHSHSSALELQLREATKDQLKKMKQAFKEIFTLLIDENFDLVQALEKMKFHKSAIFQFSEEFLRNIILLAEFQSGHRVAYIIYRLCREHPLIFKTFVVTLDLLLIKKIEYESAISIELCIFYIDLFFYGFFFTAKSLVEKIFPFSLVYMIDLMIRMPPIAEWEVFLPKRYVYKLKMMSSKGLNDQVRAAKDQFELLEVLTGKIQEEMIQLKVKYTTNPCPESEFSKNENLDRLYEETFYKYEELRKQLDYLEKNSGFTPAKPLSLVKEECEHFDPQFKLPEPLYKLYKQKEVPQIEIKKIKKSQMNDIFEDEIFLVQLKTCSSIEKAVDLSCYFIANLSKESNQEQLIEYIINCCHHESNMDLIMKVIREINCECCEIGQYLKKKVYKITSQIKMNKKYLNLICEAIKFEMIDSMVVLDYISKRLKFERIEFNALETIRECCNILELLGQSVYHESLKTNIFINTLFYSIEEKIKEKKISNDFALNMKCLKNYLRKLHFRPSLLNCERAHERETLSELVGEFSLHEHFDFILQRIKELIASKPNNKTEEAYNKKRIINYIIESIENESSFIQTFYEASLVQEINNKEIKEEIISQCIIKIQTLICSNIQQALKWSRFLGELYNYEILNRKKLTEILEEKLLYCAKINTEVKFENMSQCIIECLKISKSYIIESEAIREANHYVLNFLLKFKRSILKYLSGNSYDNRIQFDNIDTEHEFEELLSYFHPVLLLKFKTFEEIDLWSEKVKFLSPNNSLLSVNLYENLELYQAEEFTEEFEVSKRNKKLINEVSFESGEKIDLQPYTSLKRVESVENQIELINENFRINKTEILGEEDKNLIKQENENLEKELNKMMGLTLEMEINRNFPQIEFTPKNELTEIKPIGCFKKIVNNKGKKIKIITRKIHESSTSTENT